MSPHAFVHRCALVPLLLLSACRAQKRPAQVVPAPLAGVEFAECSAVHDGPVCTLRRSRILRVLVPPGVENVRWSGADVVTPPSEKVESTLLHVHPNVVEVVFDASLNGSSVRFSLRVEDVKIPPFVEPLSGLLSGGRYDEADGLLLSSAERGEASGDAALAAAATTARAQVALARGDLTGAARLYGLSSAAHAAIGELSRAASDASAEAHLFEQAGRWNDSAAAIARARGWAKSSYEARAVVVQCEGALAAATGDLRGALRTLGEAETMARRMGLADVAAAVANDRAVAFIRAGLTGDAIAEYEAIVSDETLDPCTLSDAWLNLGWAKLEKNDTRASGTPLDDPEPALRKAIAAAGSKAACPSAGAETNARSNLAWALLQKGDVVGARNELGRARKALVDLPREVLAFFRFLDGEIALTSGHPREAERIYADVEDAASRGGSSGEAFRAACGRAEALFRTTRRREALEVLHRADARVTDARLALAVDEGRSSFVGASARATRLETEILLSDGQPLEALLAVRRGHSRAFRDVARDEKLSLRDAATREQFYVALSAYREARDALVGDEVRDRGRSISGLRMAHEGREREKADVRLKLEELVRLTPMAERGTAPRPEGVAGERLVAFASLERGWVAFVDDGKSVAATPLGVFDPNEPSDALASHLLAPIERDLAGATRISLIVDDALSGVDVHALTLDGRPLVARAPVEYIEDVGGPPVTVKLERPLFVANPRGDLPTTETEVARAAHRAWGREAEVVTGRAATRARVLELLPSEDFFHYAGHGTFRGIEGWQSELQLSSGALTIGDILSLRKAPRAVVLSGCETAKAQSHGRPAGIGLASAFLAAGSEVVVGATRGVLDEATADLMGAFYDALDADQEHDVARALAVAQQREIGRLPLEAWSAFRVVRR